MYLGIGVDVTGEAGCFMVRLATPPRVPIKIYFASVSGSFGVFASVVQQGQSDWTRERSPRRWPYRSAMR